MEKIGLVRLYKKYIRGIEKEGPVINITIQVCSLTKTVCKAINLDSPKIYINSKILKHMFDKRPAEEFDFLIHNITQIIFYPDHIYKNELSKRGQYVFVKTIGKFKYLCSIENTEELDGHTNQDKMNYIVTAFRVEESYLRKFKLLWSWKGGTPSS